MVLPMNTIGPSDEISRRMARPSVVLPEPDSPTTPSVSPLRTSTLTPSTALMWPTTLRSTPRLIGNQTFRSLVSHHDRRVGPRRRRIGLRLGGEQRARVGMLGRGEHALDRPCSTILPLLHHADPVGDLAHDAEVVGDEQHRHAEPRLHVLEQLQDLRLHRDVERGGRLVGDQQVGLVGRAPWRSSRAGAGRRRADADSCRAALCGSGMPTWSSSSRMRARAASPVSP